MMIQIVFDIILIILWTICAVLNLITGHIVIAVLNILCAVCWIINLILHIKILILHIKTRRYFK